LLVVTGEELSGIERYCDTVPRASADVERIGSFTVFIGRSRQSFYARPAAPFMAPVGAGESIWSGPGNGNCGFQRHSNGCMR